MNRVLYVEGDPVTDLSELPVIIDPLVSGHRRGKIANELKALILCKHKNDETDLSDVNDWMKAVAEQEPRLISAIEFLLEEREIIISDDPVETQLITTSGGIFQSILGDHFIMENDAIRVSPHSPPTIQQAYETAGKMVDFRNTTAKIKEFVTWKLGAFIDACDNYFGEAEFDMGQIIAMTGSAYSTCMAAKATFLAFPQRYKMLSFTHHKEAKQKKFKEDETMHECLALAERHLMSMGEFRKLLSFAHAQRPEGLASLTPELRENRSALMEHLTNDKKARGKWVFQYDDIWWSLIGPLEDIPKKATTIIDCSKASMRTLDSLEPKELPTWNPQS